MNTIRTLRPILNRCLVKRIVPKQVTPGGIILSEKSVEKEARFGHIIAVGPGERSEKGELLPLQVKPGDYVLLPEYQGTRVPIEDADNEYFIFRDTDFLATVEGVKH